MAAADGRMGRVRRAFAARDHLGFGGTLPTTAVAGGRKFRSPIWPLRDLGRRLFGVCRGRIPWPSMV
jgi:hypothetical protein